MIENLLSYRVDERDEVKFIKDEKWKKKHFPSIFYIYSLLPWCISFTFKKSLESWFINWWNSTQSEIFLNDIKEKSILNKFIELEELFFIDDMLKECPKTYIQNLCTKIYKETIQLIKTQNEDCMNTILHFSTNIICFVIISDYSILGNQELVLINSLVREFIYNLSNTIKDFSILLLTNLCIWFHSTHGWELIFGFVYKDFGFAQIISGLVFTFLVILDTILKYWIFLYLNRISPSLVVIYHSMNDWQKNRFTSMNFKFLSKKDNFYFSPL